MPSVESAAIEKRTAKIFAVRQITHDDRAFLMSVFAKGNIDDASEATINKIYDAIAAGKIRVTP